MSNYTIHCVGFEQTQQASIAAILDLADPALNHSWSITESTESDIVMINMQKEEIQQLGAQYSNLPEYRIMLVADHSRESFQNYWFLEKKEQAPPSLRVLVDLLNQVGICLDEAAINEVQDNHEEPVEIVVPDDTVDLPVQVVELEQLDTQEGSELEDEQFDIQENSEPEPELLDTQEDSELEDEPIEVADVLVTDEPGIKHENIEKSQRKLSVDNYFFGLLLQASKEKKYRIIKLNTLPVLYLTPEESCYYFSGTEEELLQYCLVMPKNLNVKVLSRAKFNKAIKSEPSELAQKDFSSLISYAVIHVSQGQLLDGQSASQGVVLRSMPDVEGDSILNRYKDIAEHMYQQEGSLFDVAEKLQVSLADVFDFYNVCYLLGYIKVTTTGAKDLETDSTKTLGRFLKSFFTK